MSLISYFPMHIAAWLCFLPVLFQLGVVAAEGTDKRAPIVIGASVSLSGLAAEQGRNWLDGATLAVEELQRAGQGVLLKVEDDQTTPARVSGVIRKLVTFDKAQAIIGGTWDFTSEAAHPVVEQLKIPYLTPSNPPEIIDATARNNPFVFTNGLSLLATERAMRAFLLKFKPASAAIIVPNVSFGTLHGDMLEKLAAETGVRITSRHNLEYAGYQETLRALALKFAKIEKPDLVFCLSDYSGIDVFVSQLEMLRFSPLVLTTQHLDQAIALSGRPERYARAYGIYPQISDAGFSQRFAARFGHAPRVYAANGYDAVMFLSAALRAGVDFTKPGFEYRGILGPYEVRAETRALLSQDRATVMGLTNGEFKEQPLSSGKELE